jgi:hypothetical protein
MKPKKLKLELVHYTHGGVADAVCGLPRRGREKSRFTIDPRKVTCKACKRTKLCSTVLQEVVEHVQKFGPKGCQREQCQACK